VQDGEKGRPVAQCRLRFVVLALLATATVLVVSSCGSDPYSGTWSATTTAGNVTMHIEKHGDGWTVTDSLGNSINVVEKDGILVEAGAKSGGFTWERVGPLLKARYEGNTVLDFVRLKQ
jgi:hypothetical protein